MYTSNGGSILLSFTSDNSVTDQGFEISYTCNDMLTTSTTTITPPIDCGGQLSGESGQIKSPGWPNSYPNYASCLWEINCNAGSTLEIVFDSLSIEYDSNCK